MPSFAHQLFNLYNQLSYDKGVENERKRLWPCFIDAINIRVRNREYDQSFSPKIKKVLLRVTYVRITAESCRIF